VGLRRVVDRAGHLAHGAHAAAWDAVRADVVESDVPRRDLRHRHFAARRAHPSTGLQVAAAIAYTGMLFTWLLVAVRTARGSLRGNLLKVAPSSAPVKASKDPAA
jgi:hypothetical protein